MDKATQTVTPGQGSPRLGRDVRTGAAIVGCGATTTVLDPTIVSVAIDPAADAGLWPDRLPGRPARLDRRKIPGVDRLSGGSRGRGRPRPAAHQRHALLADRHGRILGA